MHSSTSTYGIKILRDSPEQFAAGGKGWALFRHEGLKKVPVVWRAPQVRGFIGRYVTYTGPGFREGVSLSFHDEVARFRKYALGCCEVVFNPLAQVGPPFSDPLAAQ